MKNKVPVTAIILCHINGERLNKAIASVQFCDEILILDHHSGKDWTKLQKKYHLKIIEQQKPIENFSQLRNYLAPQAKNSWILSLDSDEYIAEPELAAELIKKIINDENYNCASLIRTDIFSGDQLKHGEAGQQKIIKLYQRQQLHYERPVHEELTAIQDHEKKCLDLPIQIFHQSHLSVESFFQDVCKYAEMEAQHRAAIFNFAEKQILTQMVVYPLGKFFYNYVLKLGFLDGFAGLVYASLMSLHSIMVRVFLWEKLYVKKFANEEKN